MSRSWVELTSFKPTEYSLELLKTLEGAGLPCPVLRGGAPRDMFLDRAHMINDYDICCQLGDIGQTLTGTESEIALTYNRFLKDSLPQATDFSDMTVDRIPPNGTLFIAVEFTIQGQRISLTTDGRNDPIEVSVLSGDAPINSIGINAAGQILAHPLFEDHARRLIYAPFEGMRPRRLSERFEHMAAKFHGLTLAPPLERVMPPDIPRFR